MTLLFAQELLLLIVSVFFTLSFLSSGVFIAVLSYRRMANL